MTSRTFPDRPGPSRTTPDHPEPSRQLYGRVTDLATDRHGSDPGQSVAVRELGVTVALHMQFDGIKRSQICTIIMIIATVKSNSVPF